MINLHLPRINALSLLYIYIDAFNKGEARGGVNYAGKERLMSSESKRIIAKSMRKIHARARG